MNLGRKTKQMLTKQLARARRRIAQLERLLVEGKRCELEAHEAREYAESILATVWEPLVVLDKHLRVISASRSFYTTFKVSSEETAGKLLYELGNRQWDIPELRQLLENILAENTTLDDYEVEHDFPNIGRKIMLLNARRIWEGAEEPQRILLAIKDVTEQKRLEEELRRAHKMEAVGQLAGGLAHDFNNMLTAILGYSELLLELLPAEDPARDAAEQISQAGHSAAALTRKLLVLGRRQVLRPEVLVLNDVLTPMEKILRRAVGERIELEMTLEPQLAAVEVDRSLMEQVVMNLVLNARDAMPDGGKLTIETANVSLDREFAKRHPAFEPGRYVLLAVTDTGMGMDRETQSRIFEPFFTTKRAGKGTGLGLSTVYSTIGQSGGHVYVSSELGVGTRFEIYLPALGEKAQRKVHWETAVSTATPAETNMVESPEGTAKEKLQVETPHRKRLAEPQTILVVDDDVSVRKLAATMLRSDGYQVLEASGGREALSMCEKHQGKIALSLTDVIMQDMGGRELAHQLSALTPEMKILYMSGYAIAEKGELEPGMPFLRKPFSKEALLSKVREVLEVSVE